jgi:hypothetical protein
MRLILVIGLLMISGCSLWSGKSSSEIPKQPDAPIGGVMSKLGDEIDKSDSRLAAAVQVASEANAAGKPTVVAAELSVAKSYLPAPTSGDYAYARLRADKGDPKEYEAAQAAGKRLLAIVDSQWAKMETDQFEAKRVSNLKDKAIADLKTEVERVRHEGITNLFTAAGAGLFVIGALCLAFFSKTAGVCLMAAGAAAGSVPFVIGSAYFHLIASVGLGVAVIMGLSYLWWVIRKAEKPPEDKPDGEAKA